MGDWVAKDAAQRGRIAGAVQPARCLAPEHDPRMTSEHNTTARWFRPGVDFEEGGNQSARRKPSESSWDQLKFNPQTTFVVEVERVIDVQGVQHRKSIQMGSHPHINPSLKKDDNSIFIAHLSTECSLYGQHQLKKSKKSCKSLIANRLVKNVTDHQKDASVGL